MYLPSTTWTRLILAVALIQGLFTLGLEAYVFAIVEDGLDPAAYQVASGHTVPMYFSLFIFAFLYGLVIVYDALRLSSMIQVVGLCLYNLLLLIYAAVQPLHVKKALDTLSASLVSGVRPILPQEHNTWQRIYPVLLTLISVQATALATLCFLAYKLQSEFAWLMYQVIHADLFMKRRLLTLQVYMALIKFDFFFFMGFLVQIVTLVVDQKDPEFGLSIAGIFVTLVVTYVAIYYAMVESKPGTTAIIVTYVGATLYLGYKLSVLYKETNYLLIVFAAITLVMMVCTIVTAILCMVNFDNGLKIYTMPQKMGSEEDSYLCYTQDRSYPHQSSRMELD